MADPSWPSAGQDGGRDDRHGPVEVPEQRDAQPPMPPAARPGPTVALGTLINNNYEITAVLKMGGMGEVYRGENVFTRDPVAIKLVKPDLAGDEKIALMFRREARTLGQLVDDAIVRYYNFVQDPQIDRYCLIMEFIEGIQLSERIGAGGPLSANEARNLMRRLAAGLAKAHAMDVIHRDLSPDNVMLPGGSVADAKLIDFGIARSPLMAEGTMAGQFAGKLRYVSPEQLGHFGGAIGPATDIYGLGLLIAATVRGAALPMGESIVEAVEARRSVPDLSDIPDSLRPVLSRMLRPDPKDRPVGMRAVLAMLGDASLSQEPRPAAPPPATPGLRLPPGAGAFGAGLADMTSSASVPMPGIARSRMALGAGVLLIAAVLAVVGWYGWRDRSFGPEAGPALADANATEETAPVSRAAFLAAYPAGDCALALRRASGPSAGQVEGFGVEADWSGLPEAFDEAFGARPDVVAREVDPAQCPVLDFARPFLTADPATALGLTLDSDTVESGATLAGRLTDSLARPVWLAVVAPDGSVWNISDRLSGVVDDRRALRVGLELPPGAAPTGELVLAVASPKPLASAAAAAPGTQAADLLPLVVAELDRRGGEVAVSLAYVTVEPAAEETEPGQ